MPKFNDQLLAMFLKRTPFYAGGWGDEGLIRDVMERLAAPDDPSPIDVRWSRPGERVAEGYFRSPVADVIPLPAEACTAYFRLELPKVRDGEPPPPVCIYLAATGDQGYLARRMISGPLVRRGIGALVLENPYYGTRRPRGQRFVAPQRFVDQLMMNYATVEEGRALLAWLKGEGFEHVGVAGYSMGGFMAAYVAAATPFAIAAAPCAAGNSAGPTFTESPLAQVPAWDVLQDGLGIDARTKFLELVNSYTLTRWDPPVDAESAIIVGLTHDLIIPPAEVKALHAHWPGSRLRWVNASHMSGVYTRVRAVREAIYDAFSIRLYKASRASTDSQV